MSEQIRKAIAKAAASKMLEAVTGVDIACDDNLRDTPRRIVDMYFEMFINIRGDFPESEMTAFPNDHNYDQLIVNAKVPVSSMCSHHLLPFSGRAHFGYLPGDKLVGLSKISRMIQHYALRPQIQEAMTHQIIKRFVELVEPRWCMLIISCSHSCACVRGAKSEGAVMKTSAIGGEDRDNESLKHEFMALLSEGI